MPGLKKKILFKKSHCHIHATLRQRSDAVHKLRFQHTVKTLCRALNVNISTCYKHFPAEPAPRVRENQYTASLILHIHADYSKRSGAYRITCVPKRDHGINISTGQVYRLMKQMRLPKMSTVKPPRAAASKEDACLCQNLLSQRFDQKAPNLVWVCDFTYVKVAGKFHYICAILDLYARKVIACRVGSKIDRFLAIDTLRDAVRLRGVSKGVMIHTNQGSQFTSRDFRMLIDDLGMIQSFSAKGHPYDNAVMECFFKYLKKEELDRRNFQSLDLLKQSLLSYISGFYNSHRAHSHNHGLPPILAENSFLT